MFVPSGVAAPYKLINSWWCCKCNDQPPDNDDHYNDVNDAPYNHEPTDSGATRVLPTRKGVEKNVLDFISAVFTLTLINP